MSTILSKIFKKQTTDLVKEAGNIVDEVVTSKEEALTLKEKLSDTIFESSIEVLNIQKEIILAEANGNWLQRSWRPIVMLLFAFLVGAYWFGFTNPEAALAMKIFDIIELGIGGMVIGRTVEKVASNVTKNIDIEKLGKKDRKDFFNK